MSRGQTGGIAAAWPTAALLPPELLRRAGTGRGAKSIYRPRGRDRAGCV